MVDICSDCRLWRFFGESSRCLFVSFLRVIDIYGRSFSDKVIFNQDEVHLSEIAPVGDTIRKA